MCARVIGRPPIQISRLRLSRVLHTYRLLPTAAIMADGEGPAAGIGNEVRSTLGTEGHVRQKPALQMGSLYAAVSVFLLQGLSGPTCCFCSHGS